MKKWRILINPQWITEEELNLFNKYFKLDGEDFGDPITINPIVGEFEVFRKSKDFAEIAKHITGGSDNLVVLLVGSTQLNTEESKNLRKVMRCSKAIKLLVVNNKLPHIVGRIGVIQLDIDRGSEPFESIASFNYNNKEVDLKVKLTGNKLLYPNDMPYPDSFNVMVWNKYFTSNYYKYDRENFKLASNFLEPVVLELDNTLLVVDLDLSIQEDINTLEPLLKGALLTFLSNKNE